MPSERVKHLAVDEVLAIHQAVMESFGGRPGLRDGGLLESALFRPRTGYYADVLEMSAALLESLLVNHPFNDGNKRVAFFATDTFLRLNGWMIESTADDALAFILELIATAEERFAAARAWLQAHVRPLESG